MDSLLVIAAATVIVLVVFDYTNGFHDASNIIATAIASRAMTPLQAVLVVGLFEFLGPLLGGTAVADTIGSFVDISALPPLPAMAIILPQSSGTSSPGTTASPPPPRMRWLADWWGRY